ncbi:MAG: hypothetical protein SGARI_003702 [Bacillariaceae sp.]
MFALPSMPSKTFPTAIPSVWRLPRYGDDQASQSPGIGKISRLSLATEGDNQQARGQAALYNIRGNASSQAFGTSWGCYRLTCVIGSAMIMNNESMASSRLVELLGSTWKPIRSGFAELSRLAAGSDEFQLTSL